MRHANARLSLGLALMIAVVAVAVFGPALLGTDPLAQTLARRNRPPSAEAPFGTDRLGRDLLARVVYGARVALMTGAVVTVVAGASGFALGLAAGYRGGVLDSAIMRGADVAMSFPTILVAISIMAVLGQGVGNIMIALTLIHIPRVARVVRSTALEIRDREFVQAVRGAGASDVRIVTHHVGPNCFAPWLIQLTLTFVDAVRTEATLSFVGLGTPPPQPSWGNMLEESLTSIQIAPWQMMFPAGALALTILALNLLGDGARDALDPTTRGR